MKKLSKTNLIIGALAIVLIIVALFSVKKDNVENTMSNQTEVVSTIEPTQEVTDPMEETEAKIDEVANGDYTGQNVNEVTDETLQAIAEKEFIEETTEGEFDYITPEERTIQVQNDLKDMDTNEDGFLSKQEILAKGWSFPIRKGIWMYDYITDPNNDGYVWEDEMK